MENLTFISNVETFRDKIIISKFINIVSTLNVIKQKPSRSYVEYSKLLDISISSVSDYLKDAKTMKLYKNGFGLEKELTPLGEKLLYEIQSGQISNETIKEACLNVSLFNKLYKEYPQLTNSIEVYEYFKKEILDIEKINFSLVRKATRRYIEGIHNKKCEKIKRESNLKKQEVLLSNNSLNLNIHDLFNNNLKEYFIKIGLDKEDIADIVSSLRKDKQKLLIKELL